MTRMWTGVSPREMCDQHLLGEHKEIHQEIGQMKAGNWNVVKGHVKRGQFEPDIVKIRHQRLVLEMLMRGMNHNSPVDMLGIIGDSEYLDIIRIWNTITNLSMFQSILMHEANRQDLAERCEDCRERMEEVE